MSKRESLLSPYRFEIIPGSQRGDLLTNRGDFYWRLKAPNGETVADAAKGQPTYAKCYQAIVKLVKALRNPAGILLPERVT